MEWYKEYNIITYNIDVSKEALNNGGNNSTTVFDLQYNKEKTRVEVKQYIDAVFLNIFRPHNAPKVPLALMAQNKMNPYMLSTSSNKDQNYPNYQNFEMVEPEFDEDTKFFFPDVREDFDATEENTYKGNKGPVRDIVKITHYEFASSDDGGHVIIWNRKDNKMKGMSLKEMSPVVEPILCMTMTEDKGQYLVGGLKKGHLFLYNRAKGGRKLI